MQNSIYVGLSLFVVFLGFALLIVWSRRDVPVLRALITPFAVVAAAGCSLAVSSTLGFAIPLIGGLTAPSGDVRPQWAQVSPDHGIYIMLDLPGEPRLYWLPWDQKFAEELQDRMLDGALGSTRLSLPPFEFSWMILQPPEIRDLPQPKALPDKPPQGPQAPHVSA